MPYPLILAFAALLLSLASASLSLASAQGKPSPADQSPPPSLIRKLRAFLGLNPPIAVGGSRSSGSDGACLLSPWPQAPVGVNAPVLLAAGLLNEIRLERGDQLLWQQRASSTKAIEGPIPWPINPLQPGEVLTLRLRPRGAAGADFAVFRLQATSASNLKTNQETIAALGTDPQAWYRFLGGLSPHQSASAAALLSSASAPAELRQALQCTGP